MKFCAGIAGCLAVVVLSLTAGTAAAHQSPPGCSAGSLGPATILETATMHRNGEEIGFEAGYANNSPGACDVTGFTVSITFPKSDGTAGGETVIAGSNRAALGGSGVVRLPPVPYTVNFDEGVYSGPVKVTISGGTFHGGPVDTPYGEASATSTLYISRPRVSMTVTAATTDVPVGEPVTYTYRVKNESTTFPGDTGSLGMNGNQVTDDRCSPVTYVSGDGGFADVLDVGETWEFTCTTTFNQAGTIVNHAAYAGGSIRDGGPVTATAESTVRVGADLNVGLTHPNPFARGSMAWSYAVVGNVGNNPTSGNVTADFTVPPTLTVPPAIHLNRLTGDGWTCDPAGLSCSRSDPLAAGAEYPPITLIVDVGFDAPDTVTNSVTVSGGDDADPANNSASDVVAVVDQPPHGPGPPGDETSPSLTGMKVTPKRFRVPSKKAKISFVLSENAKVRFGVERKARGKWRRVKGSFKKNGKLGSNTLRFSGRVGGKKLKPGGHRLTAIATDRAGNKSLIVRRPFKILRR